ncbi:hypothetical protein FKP32DRAFT_213026 [Trametes sanguinea]|nr:hypothetical protein FKP32DRAFT_213026 [Trametes sanguinea]
MYKVHWPGPPTAGRNRYACSSSGVSPHCLIMLCSCALFGLELSSPLLTSRQHCLHTVDAVFVTRPPSLQKVTASVFVCAKAFQSSVSAAHRAESSTRSVGTHRWP